MTINKLGAIVFVHGVFKNLPPAFVDSPQLIGVVFAVFYLDVCDLLLLFLRTPPTLPDKTTTAKKSPTPT